MLREIFPLRAESRVRLAGIQPRWLNDGACRVSVFHPEDSWSLVADPKGQGRVDGSVSVAPFPSCEDVFVRTARSRQGRADRRGVANP